MVLFLIAYIRMVYSVAVFVISSPMEASSRVTHRSTTPGARRDSRSPQEAGISAYHQRTGLAPWCLHWHGTGPPRALERKGALKRRPFQARGLYLTAPEDGLGARPSGTSPFWGLQEALPSPLLLLQPLAVLPKAALLGVLRTSLRSGHGGHGLLLSFEVGCGWKRPWPKVHVISRTLMKGFR